MKELIKVKRGNALSNLWNEIWQKKFQPMKEPYRIAGFLGQHFNRVRQEKHRVMREMNISSERQYRKYKKLQRRLAKETVR